MQMSRFYHVLLCYNLQGYGWFTGTLVEGKKETKTEEVKPSKSESATSKRSGGKKSTGYEYVIPPAALAITSLNSSIKSFEGTIIQSQTFSRESSIHIKHITPITNIPFIHIEPKMFRGFGVE